MSKAPLPWNETERLRALDALGAVGSGPDAVFDSIVRLVAQSMGTPIALISLVTESHQWFKAAIGLPGVYSTSREVAFCAHAILGRDPMVVEDASRDERFASNPLVTGDPGIRFYAGAPLVTRSGHALGTLCAIDRKSYIPDAEQLTTLRDLAVVVTALLEAQADRRALAGSETRLRTLFATMSEGLVIQAPDGRIVEANAAAEQVLDLGRDQLLGQRSIDPGWRALREDGTDWPGDEHPAMVAMKTARPLRSQVMGVHAPGGPLRWISINSQPLDLPDADRNGAVVSTFVDVTRQRQLTADLQEARAALTTILDTVPARITAWRADCSNRFVNRTAAAQFGIEIDQAPGMHAERIIGAARYARARPFIDAALRGEARTHEQCDPQPDGSLRYSHVQYVPEVVDGQIVGLIAMATDVTELRESYRRVRELAQRIETIRDDERRLIALRLQEGLAQDLFAARLALGIHAREAPDPAAAAPGLQNLARLIDECIDATRELANDLWPTSLMHMTLATALEAHARQFGRLAQLQVTVTEAASLPALHSRAWLTLYRAAQEALTNVARHAHARTVSIALGGMPGAVRLRVSDDGVGMDVDAMHKAGSLGLLAMRERLQALGGRLAVQPNAPHGTVVEIVLPVPTPDP